MSQVTQRVLPSTLLKATTSARARLSSLLTVAVVMVFQAMDRLIKLFPQTMSLQIRPSEADQRVTKFAMTAVTTLIVTVIVAQPTARPLLMAQSASNGARSALLSAATALLKEAL